MNDNWQTIATTNNKILPANSYLLPNTGNWKTVNIPHNWDAYEGYRRLLHGNRHGDSWYRKNFVIKRSKSGKRFFLFFEGVGSYATVYLNGRELGKHAGGRTTFTLDATAYIKADGSPNRLAVRAYHPANIKDLPWVCGGCSDERGFSEGSQPMGIFRPVHLIITDEVRIEPFGVHAWNDSTVSERNATINITTTIKNYTAVAKEITVLQQLRDQTGTSVAVAEKIVTLKPGSIAEINQQVKLDSNVKRWSLQNPYLYNIHTLLLQDDKQSDELVTPYGIRTIKWSHTVANSSNQFFLNNQPVFINGIAEYEHLFGNSHAFSDEQVLARVRMIRAAGFNAFRDAHQPHNLRYQTYWDSLGILSWTQLSAHIWYDSKEFREQFKERLKEWVIERRNSPSVVLWGLQNESKLPRDFAEECTALIRSLDPTASSQRLITVCNGGEGTDWNVPQNWTGTYGGDPATYAADLKKQILVGEYGAWRTLDLHSDTSTATNSYTEEKMTQIMETKVRLAEVSKDSVAGHFAWLLTSHDNPGRVQGGEGYREIDRIGPVNYKGLLSPWEEPLDVFYMYRSNYAPKASSPMLYIVSHTWPERWTSPGLKNNIVVYSNCDEVELFNDINDQSLGRKRNGGTGTHFRWDSADIRYNVLYAVGYVNGQPVAKDSIVLNHLPAAPGLHLLYSGTDTLTKSRANYQYICRINCGGPEVKDVHGNIWAADRSWSLTTKNTRNSYGSSSWTQRFPEMPAFFASQRKTSHLIKGTKDRTLFQTFRYGRNDLSYSFPVQDGKYLVELYFAEPWWGIGGGLDATGFRLFDVAINDKLVLTDFDIWKLAGTNTALKKSFNVDATGGQIKISFPNVRAGQAVISAIAIATMDKTREAVPAPPQLIHDVQSKSVFKMQSWLDIGAPQFVETKQSIIALPPALYGADWLSLSETAVGNIQFNLNATADVYLAMDSDQEGTPEGFISTNSLITNDAAHNNTFQVYKKRFSKNSNVKIDLRGIKGIFAVPASGMQPAYDLKPVIAYRPSAAIIPGPGAKKIMFLEKESISFTRNAIAIKWPVNIGAADIYSLTLRYANPSPKTLAGRIEITTTEGSMFRSEKIVFTPSKTGKWSYVTVNTGTMINAGNYHVKIVADDAIGVVVSGLDIQ